MYVACQATVPSENHFTYTYIGIAYVLFVYLGAGELPEIWPPAAAERATTSLAREKRRCKQLTSEKDQLDETLTQVCSPYNARVDS